jgi:peptide deformylase
MLLPIIKYGASVLRKKAANINSPAQMKELSSNMFKTLKKYEGVGLAGPQVNILKNIFIIDTTPYKDDEGIIPTEKIFINPEIIELGNHSSYFNEGCLSIPDIFEDVSRPTSVEVSYLDENFDSHREIIDGIMARIFLHEYDHLEGILFTDRLSAIRKRLISNKLKNITKTYHQKLLK